MSVKPDIDLFASRLNYRLKPYVSYKPDPGAVAVDAFMVQWSQCVCYAFPPFSVIMRTLQKIQQDQATGVLLVPFWPTQAWWPTLTRMLIQAPLVLPNRMDTLYLPQDPCAPPETSDVLTPLPLVWEHLQSQGISSSASDIIMQSWRTSTRVQYSSYIKKWMEYCNKRKIDPISPSVASGINFLAELYHKGLSYSALNTARRALASVIVLQGNQSFGNHPLVSQFLKGTFTTRPALPKYKEVWDVNTVLEHF